MQTVIYKYANNSLFIDKIEERNSGKFILAFDGNVTGICHIGRHTAEISDGKVSLSFPLARGMYPVWVESADGRIEGEGLLYRDGKLHRAVSEEFSRAFYEIALLKDAVGTLSKEVQKISDTVFSTVIF